MVMRFLTTMLASALAIPAVAQTAPSNPPAPSPAPVPSPAPASTRPSGPPSIFVPKPQTTAASPAETAGRPREAPVNGVLYLYGDKEKCPTDADGNEVVVCVRRPAGERFRIPSDIRPESIKPEYQSFAVRGREILEQGRTGIGTCTPVGLGGQTGCESQITAQWKAEQRAKKKAAEANQPQ